MSLISCHLILFISTSNSLYSPGVIFTSHTDILSGRVAPPKMQQITKMEILENLKVNAREDWAALTPRSLKVIRCLPKPSVAGATHSLPTCVCDTRVVAYCVNSLS